MNRSLLPHCTLSLLALTACGDSLVGGSWLEELLGVEQFPAEVAWELRWYGGSDQGLQVECDLREPWTGMHALEEVYFGVAEVPPPDVVEIPEPWALVEGEGYTWGLALLVLAEPEAYWGGDPGGERTDLDFSRGIWGVVESYALLVADGDMDALRGQLLAEPEEQGEIHHGAQFVGFLPEVVLGTASLGGSLYAIEEEEQGFLREPGTPVVHLEYMEGFLWEVFEGELLGGAIRHCEDP